MQKLNRDFFLYLSKNKLLNKNAKRWGLKLGASKVVAGLTLEDAHARLQELNESNRSITLDHLGEFVFEESEAIEAFESSMAALDFLHEHEIDCYLSVKLTKLGLDVDEDLCKSHIKQLLEKAKEHGSIVNIDMEDYLHYEQTIRIIEELRTSFDNIGTVLQAYIKTGVEDTDRLKGMKLRFVKGAYKESADVALQEKQAIDKQMLDMIKTHLNNGGHTAIATHDHHIIEHVKAYAEEQSIPREQFEFQMLYGFRNDLQLSLVEEGYQVRTYVPYGKDWYGYFMRRLAERPQNLAFAMRGLLSK
ncbi:proline dehydrogenase family protein [Geomicrobium sp. JCM 19039]|uniref:proline dehydrogenase family protein n=1 Tax=Geomicrobium sp. JCM 19039 TaxID=1460636 RepID=UPI00045F19FC|nr:proline dehydrogenase family protein [Geomicrobium sp. JCM 19039]GAK11337.1 proline dehydrogenase [Geomicrobium sp. JCM 19039]